MGADSEPPFVKGEQGESKKEVTKLVEFADNFVAAKTGTPLEAVQKAILQQVLEGKKLKDIRFSGYADSSIGRQLAPKLWKLMSKVTGEKVTIKSIQAVLRELQEGQIISCLTAEFQETQGSRGAPHPHPSPKGRGVLEQGSRFCMAINTIDAPEHDITASEEPLAPIVTTDFETVLISDGEFNGGATENGSRVWVSELKEESTTRQVADVYDGDRHKEWERTADVDVDDGDRPESKWERTTEAEEGDRPSEWETADVYEGDRPEPKWSGATDAYEGDRLEEKWERTTRDVYEGEILEEEWERTADADSPESSSQTRKPPHSVKSFFRQPPFNALFSRSGMLILLFLVAPAALLGFSWLANWCGATNQVAGQLPKAKFCYDLALKLFPVSAPNPVTGAVHYNRGSYYEDLQNFDSARAEYQIAMDLGFVPAYNNQARLYIKKKDYRAAVSLLQKGLKLAEGDKMLQYPMLKNLGWARLEQGRYAEAEVHLRAAIQLNRNEASAYCLLAEVLEHRNKVSAPMAWEGCLRYANGTNPDEDMWIYQAQQSLGALGEKP